MRIWLLALAGCWTAAPVAPEAPAPHVVWVRPQVTPGGYFVPDLVTRRLETNAFDDGLDGLVGEPAVFDIDALSPAFVTRRAVIVGRVSAMTLGPTQSNAATDPRLVVQYCIDISGRVTSAHVEMRDDDRAPGRLFSTPSDHDALEKMRGWRFAPYFVAGKPVTACSFINYASISL